VLAISGIDRAQVLGLRPINFASKTAGGFVDFDFFRLSDKIIAVP